MPEPVHVAVERHHDDQGRDHLERQKADHREVAVAEAEARQRVGGGRGEEHGPERAADRELQAVREVGEEQRVAERRPVVLQRRHPRPDADVADIDLGGGADREREDPEQRPGEEQADHEVGEIGAGVGEAGAAGGGQGSALLRQQADVEEREDQADQQQDHRQHRAVRQVEVAEDRVVGIERQHLGRAAGAAAGQGQDQVEGVEGEDA